MFKKIIIFLILNLQISSLSNAYSEDKLRQFVRNNSDHIMSIIKGPKSQREQKLTAVFDEIVDSKWMAKFALGPEWRILNKEQKQEYLKVYKSYLLKIYLPKFEKYHAEKYHAEKYNITNIQNLGNDNFMVNMLITPSAQQESLKLAYRIKCYRKRCYIRDLIAENVSMITSQRSDFSAVLNNNGFEGLIKILRQKNTQN